MIDSKTLFFDCDYMEGAHPEILKRLTETNMEHTIGYGVDKYCDSARGKIREACATPDAEVFFLAGGTQTNATVLDALLKPYQGVISADSGHISVHEAGAIEASGHKVITLPNKNGKLDPKSFSDYLFSFYDDLTHEHMVTPGVLYISHPTEYGTLYTHEELQSLHDICQQYNMKLYLDGARLGYGLTADGTDVTLSVIAELCDAFYIGGTKVGALFGEAVVFPRGGASHFFSISKMHGAVIAKGRLLGIQFDTLFTDGLYFKIARHAVELAMKLKAGFSGKGYDIFIDSPTNQQFIILDNTKLAELLKTVSFDIWPKIDETHTLVRFATSWATREEDVDSLLALL